MDTDGLEKLIGRLYTAFVLRDMTFFVSGGLVLASTTRRPLDSLSSSLTSDPTFRWLGVPAFLALSYVTGVILQEFARLPLEPISQWWITVKRNRTQAPERLVVRMEKVYQKRSLHTALGTERVLFLKQVAATQASAMAALTVLTLAKAVVVPSIPWWLLLLLCLAWAAMYVDKSLQEEDILTGLEAD